MLQTFTSIPVLTEEDICFNAGFAEVTDYFKCFCFPTDSLSLCFLFLLFVFCIQCGQKLKEMNKVKVQGSLKPAGTSFLCQPCHFLIQFCSSFKLCLSLCLTFGCSQTVT